MTPWIVKTMHKQNPKAAGKKFLSIGLQLLFAAGGAAVFVYVFVTALWLLPKHAERWLDTNGVTLRSGGLMPFLALAWLAAAACGAATGVWLLRRWSARR